jgi:hypothetical protein
MVAEIAAAMGEVAAQALERGSRCGADERIRVFSKYRTAKLAAAATVALMAGGTAAAAATGALPTPTRSHDRVELTVSHQSSTPVTETEHHDDGEHHYVKAPHVDEMKHERRGAFGQIDSVNGVTDPGTCGTAATAGTFTLTGFKGDTFTVNVDPSTAFAAKDVTDASFANVCVGQLAFAKGDVTDSTVTATAVFIVPPKTEEPPSSDEQGVFGEVDSVNGVSDPGTCGAAGTDGSFTVTDRDGNTWTVNVMADTKFFAKDNSNNDASSFGDVCVGKKAGARGAVTDLIVTADSVFVLDDHGFDHNDSDHHDCDGRHGHDARFTSDPGKDWGNPDSGGHDWNNNDQGNSHNDWGGHDRNSDGGGWSHDGHDH